MAYLDNTGLSQFAKALTSKFALKKHSHSVADLPNTLVLGDKQYKVVVSSAAPTNADNNTITIVTGS